ncbi:MAG: NCS2 family permease [Chlamydiales bacterium]
MAKLLDRYFHLTESKTTLPREIVAGITSFFTVAYVLVLIPATLSQTGMDFEASMVATILIAAYSSAMMGLVANYPFILGPGVGLCVYFTYSIVLGSGHIWQIALGFVFFVGIILLILNLSKIRQLIIRVIPTNLRLATTAGLGLFLALIGLKNGGIIAFNADTTWLSFGDLRSITPIMAALALVIMSILMIFRVPGALFLGMIIVWLISLFLGLSTFNGIVSWPSSLKPLFFDLDVRGIFTVHHHLDALVSLLFVTLFNSTGSLLGLAEEGRFVIEENNQCRFPRVSRALLPDTTGTILAPLLGTTPVAVYLESAAGLHVGGRTGLVSLTAGLCFLIALFFTPIATSIPLFATAPILVIVGGLMLKSIMAINWKDPSDWIPAFLTLILIPLTYSIAIGIAVGYITYCSLKLFSGKLKEVHWLSWILAILFILKFIFFPNL